MPRSHTFLDRIAVHIRVLDFGRAALVAMVVATAACARNPAPATVAIGAASRLAPTCAEAVTRFTGVDSIGAPHQTLPAIVALESTEAAVLRSLRKRAAKLGATGLVVTEMKAPNKTAKLAAFLLAAQTGTSNGGALWSGAAIPVHVPQHAERAHAACAPRGR